MSFYQDSVLVFAKYLRNLDQWLQLAEKNANQRGFSPDNFLSTRFAPDQIPFLRQIQAACDAAKAAVARLTGNEPPKHPDVETTFAELRARIATCLAYVESFSERDLEGAEARVVPLAFKPGASALGINYFNEFALPNFFFHIVMSYAMLRHDGVPLGKLDYVGGITFHEG